MPYLPNLESSFEGQGRKKLRASDSERARAVDEKRTVLLPQQLKRFIMPEDLLHIAGKMRWDGGWVGGGGAGKAISLFGELIPRRAEWPACSLVGGKRGRSTGLE